MLNSHNGRAFSRSSALAFAVVLSVAGLGRPAGQAQSPWSGSFDERFTNHRRVAPIFTRPEVISGLPSLPLTSPDESAPEPATTASTNPPGAPEGEQPDRTGRKGVASAFKQLVISPAEAEASPAPPPSDAPQQPEPHRTAPTAPQDQPTVIWKLPLARLITSDHLNRPAAQLRAIGATRRSREGQAEPAATQQQVGRPKGYTRRGQLGSGRATWYQHPGRTASAETFHPNAPTAAHHTLPLGTRVRVVNKKNHRSIVVRINDRMPTEAKGVIDLSRGSARALGIKGDGSVALQKAE